MKKVTGIRNKEQSIVTGINHDSLLLGLSDSTTVLGQCQHQESYGIAGSNTQRLPCSGVMMCGQEAFGLRDLSLWSRIWGIVQSSFYRCVYGVNFQPNAERTQGR